MFISDVCAKLSQKKPVLMRYRYLLCLVVAVALVVSYLLYPTSSNRDPDLGINANDITEISKEIQANRHQIRTPTNYSVLTDPYFTLQIDRISKDPSTICARKTDYVDYSVCTHKEDLLWGVMMKKGFWSFDNYAMLARLLQKSPEAAFIDVGANVGLISMPLLGTIGRRRKFLCVEAHQKNARSLALGFVENKMQSQNVAIIPRALANTVDEVVKFQMTRDDTNNGALKEKIKDGAKYYTGDTITVVTATFDSHVLPVAKAMNITTAILKMDIDGSECLAMEKAERFFSEVNVLYIYLEAYYQAEHAFNSCLEKMFEELHRLSYFPFKPGSLGLNGMLKAKNYKRWSYLDILWKKIL